MTPFPHCKTIFFSRRHYSDLQHRLTYYDYESLRATKLSLVIHIYVYRHRPLVLEIIKIIWLISIALCMVLKFSRDIVVFSLATWCVVDILLLICGIFYAIMEPNIVRRRSAHATSMAKYYCGIYSFMFGVPVGTVTKLIFMFWLYGHVSFSVAFTVAACSFTAAGVAMFVGCAVLFFR